MRGNEMSGAAEQAKLQNRRGNSYSRNGIEAYSKEICRNPEIPSNWVNRALCYYECREWALLEEDCRQAIHLDGSIVKPHHMLGVALLQRREFAEGIRELEKALDLARAIYPNSNVVKRIQCELAEGKYSSWKIAVDEKSEKLCNLRRESDLERTMSGSAEQAKQHNRMGNSFSWNRLWEQAIEAYSKAITLRPQIPSYWMNRALCYYRRKKWVVLEEDCRRAIHLDSTIIKAHHMLGVALQQRQEYAEGIRELEKALDLARAIYPNSNVVKRIQCELAKGKYSSWKIAVDEKSEKLCNLREATKDVRKAAEADKPTKVPDYLCCGITLTMFQEPVITPYGHTYDKKAIIKHLEQNNFDPITRRPLDRSQLVPNWALKKAVQAFLNKHGWAYKEFIGDDDQRLKLSAKRRKEE